MTTYPIWASAGGFLGRLISFSPMACMCLIWLNINLFNWGLVLIFSLSLRAVTTFTLLYFTVSCWVYMASKNCWTVVCSFLQITRIQKLALLIAGKAWFRGILFVEWNKYEILWCLQYCVTMPMRLHLGGKLTSISNISYLMKGWLERSICNVVRVEIFFPKICSEPGDHPMPNLLLCSSNISDEQFLDLLVCGYHHFIIDLPFV